MGISFSRSGKLFAILLNILCTPFVFHLFFFNAHDSQASFFDGIAEFLPIHFTALKSFVLEVFYFFFNIYFIVKPCNSVFRCFSQLDGNYYFV
jgi:hypothetical protein